MGEGHTRGTASDPAMAGHRRRLATGGKGKNHEPVWTRLTGFGVPGRILVVYLSDASSQGTGMYQDLSRVDNPTPLPVPLPHKPGEMPHLLCCPLCL